MMTGLCLAECYQMPCTDVSTAVCLTGPLHSHLKLLAAGLKTYEIPPDYSGNLSPSCCSF